MFLSENLHLELIDHLTKELKFYLELEKVLIEEKNAISNFEYEKLNELNIKKEGILLNIIEIKNQRNQLIEKICREFRINPDEFNLSFLIDISSNKLKKRYKNLKNDLTSIAEKIKSINEVNKYVLETSLNFIQKSLQLLNQNVNPSTYSNYGKITSKNQSSLYVNKI